MAAVLVERRPDGVAVVRIDHARHNALSRAVLSELKDAVEAFAADLPRAVVVWGGDRLLSAGADVTEFAGPEEAAEISAGFHTALDALAGLARPTVAVVTGYALGGGLELALACDFRFATDAARLGQPEILLGIIPGGGGTQRLARLVGPSRAKDLIFSGRQVTAEEALVIGLVDRVFPAEQIFDEATSFAARLASGASAAIGLAKRAIDEGLAKGLDDGLALERQLFAEAFGTDDAKAGVRSFLDEGPGKARFSGR